MAAKLTLSVEESIIDQAKVLASKSGRSLSSIISEFLQSLIDRDHQKAGSDSPIINRISGVVDLAQNYDYKEEYRNYLINRYG